MRPTNWRRFDWKCKVKIIFTSWTLQTSTLTPTQLMSDRSDWSTHQFGLDEVTDHLVVEIIDGGPFDPLLNVFFLHRWKDRSWLTTVMWWCHAAMMSRTCSAFSVSSMKICCSFSLTKLMQNCSKPFLWMRRHRSDQFHGANQSVNQSISKLIKFNKERKKLLSGWIYCLQPIASTFSKFPRMPLTKPQRRKQECFVCVVYELKEEVNYWFIIF